MRGRSLKRYTQHNQHVQHIVHANGQVTKHQESTVSYHGPKSAAMQRKRLVIVLSLIIVAGGLVFGISKLVGKGVKNNPTQATSPTAVNQIVTESLSQLATERPSGLGATIGKINATEGGNTDPSLLYIKLRYYIAIADVTNARKTYDSLVNVYDPKTGYDALINQSARSLDGLKKDVEFLEKQSAQINKNAWGVSN